ncbi:cysteine desulfurase NifS [bacterium (Candidatus Torokbacteria) CG09_land_8_20_14_0_10_42_11]|nr:MAG: cysteine desulfurase NifS [bacterium (Candidatus Torokbacteria) CG09_land_8_20_14_0_10_42_11]
MPKIYLDNSATTPVDSEVLQAMLPYFSEKFGNPSSVHSFGQEAAEAVLGARDRVSRFLGCNAEEIIFTSGATEANNLALKGVMRAYFKKMGKRGHLITSQIEHKAILEPAKVLENEGYKVTYLGVDRQGIVKIKDLAKAITKDTVLASIMYANSETGAIQPIQEIGKLIKKINLNRVNPATNLVGLGLRGAGKIFVHTDAAQAAQYLDCKVDYLGVDLMTIAGHKIYAPKGVGALYRRNGVRLISLQQGGVQEYGLRAGTENVPYIVAIGKACTLVAKNKDVSKKLILTRDYLIKIIKKNIPQARLNGPRGESRLPNNLNFSFPGAEGESIVLALDMAGFAVSTGSACTAHDLAPSHVLTAMGLSPEIAHSSIRITLSKYNTMAEIKKFAQVLPKVVARLRKMAPKTVTRN